MSSTIRFREEGKDFIVFDSNIHAIAYMNKQLFSFLTNLASKKDFSISDLEKEFKDSNMVHSIVNYLNHRRLVGTW